MLSKSQFKSKLAFFFCKGTILLTKIEKKDEEKTTSTGVIVQDTFDDELESLKHDKEFAKHYRIPADQVIYSALYGFTINRGAISNYVNTICKGGVFDNSPKRKVLEHILIHMLGNNLKRAYLTEAQKINLCQIAQKANTAVITLDNGVTIEGWNKPIIEECYNLKIKYSAALRIFRQYR